MIVDADGQSRILCQATLIFSRNSPTAPRQRRRALSEFTKVFGFHENDYSKFVLILLHFPALLLT